jgi:hypothetical protein
MCVVAVYSVRDSEREYRWRCLVKLREDWLRNAPFAQIPKYDKMLIRSNFSSEGAESEVRF